MTETQETLEESGAGEEPGGKAAGSGDTWEVTTLEDSIVGGHHGARNGGRKWAAGQRKMQPVIPQDWKRERGGHEASGVVQNPGGGGGGVTREWAKESNFRGE